MPKKTKKGQKKINIFYKTGEVIPELTSDFVYFY